MGGIWTSSSSLAYNFKACVGEREEATFGPQANGEQRRWLGWPLKIPDVFKGFFLKPGAQEGPISQPLRENAHSRVLQLAGLLNLLQKGVHVHKRCFLGL